MSLSLTTICNTIYSGSYDFISISVNTPALANTAMALCRLVVTIFITERDVLSCEMNGHIHKCKNFVNNVYFLVVVLFDVLNQNMADSTLILNYSEHLVRHLKLSTARLLTISCFVFLYIHLYLRKIIACQALFLQYSFTLLMPTEIIF